MNPPARSTAASADQIGQLLAKLAREENLAMIVVTHSLATGGHDGAALRACRWHPHRTAGPLMNTRRLILRSLAHYRWTSAGVMLSAALGTAVLTGALLVGDCVRYGLTHRVALRLGRAQTALVGGDRFFRQQLADELAQWLVTDAAPAIVLPAVAINPDTDRRVNSVQLVGVDDRFFRLGPTKKNPPQFDADSAILNEPLARRLEIKPGGEIVLRVAKPGLLPRDVAMAGPDESSIAFRPTVSAIASAEDFGDFNLFANQAAPLNVFVPLSMIADKIGQPGKANLLLCTVPNRDGSVEAALGPSIRIEDLGLELRTLANGQIELRSPRVFLEPPIVAAALAAGKDASPALTYFVNDLRIADRSTPYSMVTAVSPDTYPGLFPADDQRQSHRPQPVARRRSRRQGRRQTDDAILPRR